MCGYINLISHLFSWVYNLRPWVLTQATLWFYDLILRNSFCFFHKFWLYFYEYVKDLSTNLKSIAFCHKFQTFNSFAFWEPQPWWSLNLNEKNTCIFSSIDASIQKVCKDINNSHTESRSNFGTVIKYMNKNKPSPLN